jgi:XTP/dITP diphosphohydrolase/ATP diphosphatase
MSAETTVPASAPTRDPEAVAGRRFAEAVAVMARLRGPEGCPWDREQSFDSIRKYTLEETYEVLDAIERRDLQNLKEELGDLLLQVLFYSQMAAESGYFNIAEVVEGLNRKLVRRHPHVFGETASIAAGNAAGPGMETAEIDSGQVLRNWEQIKRAEKAASGDDSTSILDAIPRSLPALMEAAKIGSRAAKSGFDWPGVEGVFAKLEEEIAELQEAIACHQDQDQDQDEDASVNGLKKANGDMDEIAAELGDLLFTAVNLARHLGVDPEMALRRTNAKFRRRFASMETSSRRPLEELAPDQLEMLWAEAKLAEDGASRMGGK